MFYVYLCEYGILGGIMLPEPCANIATAKRYGYREAVNADKPLIVVRDAVGHQWTFKTRELVNA